MCAKAGNSTDPPEPANASAGARNNMNNSEREDTDAHDVLRQLADELRHAVLGVAWRQWRALGASVVVRPTARADSRSGPDDRCGVHSLVDPEALVLVSLALMQDERRLGDVLRDWTARNSDLLSVQRTKNLAADYPDALRAPLSDRLAWIATVAQDAGKDMRWRSLSHGRAEASGRDTLPGSTPQKVSEARAYGIHAPSDASTKSRATRARLTADATLLLRLRLGIGVGVKADLLAFLLTQNEAWLSVRDIAEAIRYSVAAVRRAVDDLATARMIELRLGQAASYRATHAAWSPILGFTGYPPQWAGWHERFVFASDFLHWVDTSRNHSMSVYAFGVKGRQLIERHCRAFTHNEEAIGGGHTPVQNWGAAVSRPVRALATWMDEMA
jgi:hypothetical protein